MTGAQLQLEQQPGFSWSALRLLPKLLWIPLIAVLLVSLAICALGEYSARRAVASGNRVAQVLGRLEALAEVKSLSIDLESGERGFVLTHDGYYLEPYRQAVRRLPDAQRLLRSLSVELPDADSRLKSIDTLIAQRIAAAAAVIGTFNAGHETEALAALRSAGERRSALDLRAELDALALRSESELLTVDQEQTAGAAWLRAGVLLMALVNLGLLVLVARLFAAEARRQERRRFVAESEAKQLELLVDVRTRELSALSTHLQEFAEKERAALARNLHDELGGLLTAAKMDLSWLQTRVTEPAFGDRLAQLGGVLDEAMDLKRRVVEDLRPSLLDHFGLPIALRAHVETVCVKANLKWEVNVADEVGPVPKDVAIALFRVMQEGLTNVIRHARAHHVRLDLACDARRYRLRLSDDGCGFDLADPGFRWSHGLMGMRHRVQALGGVFGIESSPTQGTRLSVEVPVAA